MCDKEKKGVLSSHQTKIFTAGGLVTSIRAVNGTPTPRLFETAIPPCARRPTPGAVETAAGSSGSLFSRSRPLHLRWAGRIRTRFAAAAAGGIFSGRVLVALRRSQSSDTDGANPIGRARCWPSRTWLAVLKRHVPAAPLSSVTECERTSLRTENSIPDPRPKLVSEEPLSA